MNIKDTNRKKIVFSGVKPSNQATLGNYIGAIKSWLTMQSDFKCYFSVVDLHSITIRQDPKELRENTLNLFATYLACGIDPAKSTLFIQSQVSEHAELGWVLGCQSYMGELNRMTQFKDKSTKSGKNIPSGLYVYPVLMASDILLYDTEVVPVGDDQKQHVELTRDLAGRVNSTYGEGTLVLPKPFIPKVGARVMDLQNPEQKMGKSDSTAKGAIYLEDSPDDIVKKFKKAVTDSGDVIEYTDDKPGIQNLLSIQMALLDKPLEDIIQSYQGKKYGHLKIDTAEIVVEIFKPIREKKKQLLEDPGFLYQVMRDGANKAKTTARTTLNRVYDAMGFVVG